MSRLPRVAGSFLPISLVVLSACTSSPMEQIPPRLPTAVDDPSLGDVTNAGRVKSITVNPTDPKNTIIAMQFGGMWRTYGGGNAWFRVYTLPEHYVNDVEFGADGKTVVAAVFRDNRVPSGAGIYVSRTNGDFWSRPATGVVPTSPWAPAPTSAYSVDRAPDERGLWYVGTDFGVAVSQDDGATWTHVKVVPNPTSRAKVQSVLAFSGGRVLALTLDGLFRSDDRGTTWREVIADDFGMGAPGGGNFGTANNKMDRSPFEPWAFVLKEYHFNSQEPGNGGGTLWFYELDTDTATPLPLPQGRSRGPFVRVSKDDLLGGKNIRVWVGEGWDGNYVVREDAASIRALRADPDHNDWVSFIAEAGIHADMGDLGLDGDLKPALLGSDGGIFKPRMTPDWWKFGGKHKWMSAAVPGSGMNSLQISDLAGTNFTQPNGQITTSLYFTTQDNRIWASPDGGHTWPVNDTQEGFGLECRSDAKAGESAQIAYVRIGGSSPSTAFADANLANRRGVPNVDENGHALDNMQNPYFVYQQQGSHPSDWVRLRRPAGVPQREVYYSETSGDSWRKVGIVNFSSAGEIRSAGAVSWLPVFLGGTANPVGLVPLVGFYPDPVTGATVLTYDDSDAVRLPGGGSLGQRFTEFDTHAIFGVQPSDWRHVIAPDIVANNVKVTRDGGASWGVDQGLTAEVLKGGSLMMWGGKPDLMEVTEIAFDPYHSGRILVGTRDAGIICTADDGRTWRTVYDSDKVNYITGFHFHPSGAVYISSYGQGLWYMKAAKGCPKSYRLKWDVSPPVVNPNAESTGALARDANLPPPPPPRGIADPSNPKLFLSASDSTGTTTVLGPDDVLEVSGRGFPAGEDVGVRIRGGKLLDETIHADPDGLFSTTVRLPADLPYGASTLEAVSGSKGEVLTTSEFVKAHSDKGRAREEVVRKAPEAPSR